MKKSINCIAADLGASGGKLIRGCFDGSLIRLEEVYRFANGPVRLKDSIYWDALHLFEEVKKGLAMAGRGSAGRPASIGLDTWGNDFCLLDRDGELLENPHSYRDPRTDGVMDRAFTRMSRRELYQRTGVQFMQHNTLFQLYSLVLADSRLLPAAATYLMVPDLFNYWLTGEKCCEYTNATTTQFYDPYSQSWCEPILSAFNIPARIMPAIIRPGSRLGNLENWLCEELNMEPVPVIAVGTHDTASAVSAMPAHNSDYAFLSSGTWSLLGAEALNPVVNEAGLTHNFSCYGGVCDTYLVWKNIQALWLLQECQRAWQGRGLIYSYEKLLAMARRSRPLGSLIDVDDRKFLTPGDFPALIAEFCRSTGQKEPMDVGSTVRCILESLALKYRYTFERLQEVTGKKLNGVYVLGGGARNGLLNRLTAEATGVPVMAGLPEATSVGNIMLQLITLGEVGSLAQSREIIGRSFKSRTYAAEMTPQWDGAYKRFVSMLDGERK